MNEPSARIAHGSPQEKRALLSQLLQRQAAQSATVLPLSYNQQALWLLARVAPESWAYNVLFSARIRTDIDLEALRGALQTLMERHPSLRTTYHARHEQPEQHIHAQQPLHCDVIDASAWPAQAIDTHLMAVARRPFDLEHGPLLRVAVVTRAVQDHIFLLVIHHIAVDLWSLGLLLEEFGALYAAASGGRQASLPPLAHDYTDYVRWQASMIASPAGDKLWTFWQHQLSGMPLELALPTDRPRPAVQTYHGASSPFVLSALLTGQLKGLAKAHGVTLHTLLLAAFYVLLSRYTGQDDLVVGTFMAGRMRPEFRRIVGYCANPVVLRARCAGNPAFTAFLAEVHRTMLAALKHQDFPFALLVERLQPVRHASRSPLFQVAFVLQQLPRQDALLRCFVPGLPERQIDFGGMVLEPFIIPQQEGQFDLTLEVAEVDARLGGVWKYNTDLFDAATMTRVTGHLQTLLAGIVEDATQPLWRLPLLTAAERQQVVQDWGNAKAIYAATPCLHRWFEAQVEGAPHAIAVSADGSHLTYTELNRRANQLAHYLQELGVGPDVLVGLYVERSPELVIGILAILKAGGAYVPLDPRYPAERLAFMLDDARITVVLTQATLAATLPDHSARLVCVDSDLAGLAQRPGTNVHSSVRPEDLAYVMYTSGSTGRPKGVMVTHANVVRLFTATQAWLQFQARDVWTLFHSYAFDFSVWELWGALLYGGRVVLVPFQVSRSPAAFYALLCREGVTVLNQTPSAFRQLIHAEEAHGSPSQELALRLVIFGGEALEMQSVRPWFARHGDRRPQLVNMYGITETTVHVTYRPLTMADLRPTQGSPIGVPLPDLALYVLDASGNPTPIGVPGEIHVGGAGVARGYLHRPELTAQRFIPDPFSQDATARLYRSGDLARYLPDGSLEYLGRMDQQVKIRGFRIELGEIEVVLCQHPMVREVVVLAREDTPGEKQLVAYVVPQRSATPTHRALRAFLRPKLPEYMLPAAFVWIETLPLTTNGKVDRQALPTPAPTRPALARVYVAPRSPIERDLADIFSQVLRLQHVGVHDGFFELGGDSIRSLQIQAMAQARGMHFPLTSLWQHQTVAELARIVEPLVSGPPAPPYTAVLSLLSQEDRHTLPADVEDAYPLTMFQAEMLRYSRQYPSSPVYHVVLSYYVRTRFAAQAWHKAWNRLMRRHAVLRTAFDFDNFRLPLQLVHRTAPARLDEDDLRAWSPARQEAYLAAWRQAEATRPFDWSVPPLLRIQVHHCTADTFWLTLSFHHAILDGWSVAVMLTELWQSYLALLDTPFAAPAPALTLTFRDFVAQEQRLLQSAASQHYWQQQLQGSRRTALSRGTRRLQSGAPPQSEEIEATLPARVLAGLQRRAQSAAVPLKSVFLAVHLRVLGILSGQTQVLTGLLGHARPAGFEAERVLGMFLNVVPLRVQLPSGSWHDLIAAAFQAEQDLFPFRHYPVAPMVPHARPWSAFATVFNFIHFHIYQNLQGLPNFTYLEGRFSDRFPYTLKANFIVNPMTSQCSININFDKSIIDKQEIRKIMRLFHENVISVARE